jgi:hypothetical protein
VDQALTLDRVGPEALTQLTSPSELLGHMPAVTVSEEAVQRVTHGNPVRGVPPEATDPMRHVRILDGAGHVLAVAEARPGGLLQPIVVLR